uniref:Reverse transcriptase domain-containing protein n=1 Tax=Acanthochromis polyacanthus TaxID=80966 RepID=A0A3Q1EYB7_9TELE
MIEGKLRFAKHKYYEHGNRASRLLVFKLQKQQSYNTVHKLKLGDRSIVKPKEIAETFAKFYESLYQDSDTCPDEPKIKCFQEDLTPLLLNAYHYSLETKNYGPSWSEATIVVLYKEGKDPTDCGSYRPLSMLNGDVRILTAALACRLNNIITEIIHPDQTGFIAGRHYGNNLHRVLNIISHQQHNKIMTTVLSLDAQKAFNRVSWKYLIQTLIRFNLGPKFRDWIETIYSSPQAAVRVNGFQCARFNLKRGCQQGCPPSPLLFAISIEPLAQLIRDDSDIEGVTIGEEVHKISLYADDVLLYLTEPSITVPCLLREISSYEYFSGYKINVDKTEAMDVLVNLISDIFTFSKLLSSVENKW